MKNKIILSTLLAIATLFISCHKESFDEKMVKEMQDYTAKQCPRQMDKFTFEMSRTYVPDKRELIIKMVLVGDGDTPKICTPEARKKYRTATLRSLHNDLQLKSMKDSSVTFVHQFYSKKTGQMYFQERFTKQEYENVDGTIVDELTPKSTEEVDTIYTE